MGSETQLRILSFNCWDLKYVSRYRSERIAGIATGISRADYDIVALQELWVYADYEYVRDHISDRLRYSKFFYSGALGAGLALFSRFPIISTSIHPYSLCGAPLDVVAGDWFVGKAASSIVISHPVLGQVEIFNTHLFAKGGEDGPEYLRAHRLVNAWELAKLVKQAAELGRYVIAAGDYNSIPTTLPMTIIRDYASLSDSWVITHTDYGQSFSASQTRPTTQEAIQRYGVTADSPLNSYSAGKPIDPTAREQHGKRLDYVLYRQPHKHYPNVAIPVIKAKHAKVVFTDHVPGHNFSFSDHFGLEVVLEIITPDWPSSTPTQPSSLPPPESPSLSPESVTTTIQALTVAYRISLTRSNRELTIFGISIFLLLGLVISSGWLTTHWINGLFVLFTMFISWLATTHLYEGFLYGNWERNALMNVIEELEIYRQSNSGNGQGRG